MVGGVEAGMYVRMDREKYRRMDGRTERMMDEWKIYRKME